MRFALAGFGLESVTFLPETTGVSDFERAATRGGDIIGANRGTNSVLGGFIEVAEGHRDSLHGVVSVNAGAAAAASDEAFEKYAGEIVAGLEAVRGEVDGLLLHLHGALATPTRRRADAEVLGLVRTAMGPDFPVAVGMDLHANVGPEALESTNVLTGYYFSPHTDMAQTGERAARILRRAMLGEVHPTMAIAKPGIILPSIFSATRLEPLAELIRRARAFEREESRVLDISIFCGFAYADVPDCGMSMVVVTDDDASLAQAIADELSRQAWAWRERLFQRDLVHDVDSGLARARQLARTATKPICLLEHADRLNDSTYVLRALIDSDTERAYAPFMFDPQSAARCVEVGAGHTLSLSLGGKSSPEAGGPIEVMAEILWAGRKRFVIGGPLYTGAQIDVGNAALLRIGGVWVSLISIQWSAIDLDCFTEFDLDPAAFDYILLRSKTHFRHVYEPLCEEIVIVDTPDWGPARLESLGYEFADRNAFPLTAEAKGEGYAR